MTANQLVWMLVAIEAAGIGGCAASGADRDVRDAGRDDAAVEDDGGDDDAASGDRDAGSDDGGPSTRLDAGPACVEAAQPCTADDVCCGALGCGTTAAGSVCCGAEGATCATGEGCCGDLLCLDGRCGVPMCLAGTEPCETDDECCDGRWCATTSLGQVCCGSIGASCATSGGTDCCGSLSCVSGRCASTRACTSPCFPAPALDLERSRLAAIGGSFLGICGDAAHTYGFHVPAARLPSSDYSLRGAANVPVCAWHACAIDIGMDWAASRDWLRWLIRGIIEHRITGVAEVIGSYDGVNVRYWSDSSGWTVDGARYTGSGHDSWTHVSIHRSTALDDHGILAGWTATSGPR